MLLANRLPVETFLLKTKEEEKRESVFRDSKREGKAEVWK